MTIYRLVCGLYMTVSRILEGFFKNRGEAGTSERISLSRFSFTGKRNVSPSGSLAKTDSTSSSCKGRAFPETLHTQVIIINNNANFHIHHI